jgi:Cysteine-rich secretory protein family
LGKLAQTWSNDCQFNHGNPVFEASVVGFNTVGGNLWASEGPFDADKIVDSWYNDNVNFSADTQSCVLDKVCGPYKQVSPVRQLVDLHFVQIVDVSRIQGISCAQQIFATRFRSKQFGRKEYSILFTHSHFHEQLSRHQQVNFAVTVTQF